MSITLPYASPAQYAADLLDTAARTSEIAGKTLDFSRDELAAVRGTGYAVLALGERIEDAARGGWTAAELDAVRGELARADGKCGTLAAIATGAAAFAGTQLHGAPLPGRLVLAVAVAAFAAAVVVLLAALRPRTGRSGWCLYADLTDSQISVLDGAALAVTDLRGLSGLARRKYRFVRAAVDLAVAGTVLLAAGMLAGAVIA